MKRFLPALLLLVGFGANPRAAAQAAPTAAIAYASYLGGGGNGYTTDTGFGVTVGGDGALYVLGQTSSEPFPHTAVIGGFDTGYGTFVTKLSADGKTRIYSTFLSGLSGRALAVDGAGSVYLTGETGGVLPGTSSAQTDFGGSSDAFVLKLTPDGTAVVYATYLGGGDLDLGRGIQVDPDGNAYVVGWTTSTNFPVTIGAAQPTLGGGYDAFVAKLNPDGTQIVYATYLGGSAFESGAALALDPQRRAVVVGRTASTNFPSATHPVRFGSEVRATHAYVARLSANGQGVDYLTLIAGEEYDAAARVVLAADGSPVVLGQTESAGLPTTPGVLQPAYRGSRDLFVAKLTPDGGALTFCTYLGTAGFDTVGDSQYAGNFTVGGVFVSGTSLLTESGGLALDAAGNILVSGSTGADSWPGTRAASAGGVEVVIAKLSPAADQLMWLNLLGGRGDDYNFGLASDGQGGAWITGQADRPFFPPYLPTTSGAVQPAYGGGVSDAFVSRIADAAGLPVNDDFAARLPLTGVRITAAGRNLGATKEAGEPDHAGNPGGTSLWWRWTAPADGRLTLSTEGSDFDTLLAAYTGET
ncbi:MAG TPA: SBBP repeat-containing protein, partial [Candidatus Limnocylindria bacterium]|nr:SBBP repeat-containing protein [Candidatus Limnocylindria bacterium]